MTQVLWCAGGSVSLPQDRAEFPAASLAWVTAAGIQPEWIDEIHWLTGGSRAGPAPRWPAKLSAFTWADLPLLDHALLHAASHAILSGERGLVLLGEEEEDQVHLLVLCSEQAAAARGLSPAAALPARFSITEAGGPESLPVDLQRQLEQANLSSSGASLLAACDDAGRMPGYLPAGWRSLEGDNSGCAVGLCNRLVDALRAGGGDLGLLVSLAAQGPGMVTVVERWQG